MEEQCYPLLNEFKICAFKEKNRAKLRVIHIPTGKRRKFDCVHSITDMPFGNIEKFKTDPDYQKKKLAEMKMISEKEFKQYGITCNDALNNARSYAEGLSELSKDAIPSELFDLLIELDKSVIGTDYPLNSEIARFVAQQKPELKDKFLSYLKEKHKESLGKKDCRGIITDAEKFFGENEDEKDKYLRSLGCHQCKETIDSIGDPYFIKECYDFIKRANLGYKKLKKIPKKIGNLKNLQELYLSSNQLTKIPKEIGNLKNLKEIDLGNNKLVEIPKEFENLKKIYQIYLDNNQLTEIPKWIVNLNNLQTFCLTANKSIKIPKDILDLKKIQFDCPNKTKLRELRTELAYPKDIKRLRIEYDKVIEHLKN